MFIFWIQQAWKHLTVVNIDRSCRISADEFMVDIDAGAIAAATDHRVVIPDLILATEQRRAQGGGPGGIPSAQSAISTGVLRLPSWSRTL